MKSNEVLYSDGNNDECYTPAYVVQLILPQLQKFKDKIIWCPFDTEESEFVKVLKENNFNVVYSHIKYGQDFYNYEPEKWDIILSNPPFTNKRKIFERAMSFNKPFALIMSVVWLNDKAPKEIFGNEMQLFLMKNRIKFISPNGDVMGTPTFASAYFCRNFLDKDIIVEEDKWKLFD